MRAGYWKNRLRRCGRQEAEAIALATNTMHKLADYIISAVTVPFLHIADATAEAILASPSRQPLLLATAFTMEQDFYTAPLDEFLASAGGRVHIPETQHRHIVHQVIYEELCKVLLIQIRAQPICR